MAFDVALGEHDRECIPYLMPEYKVLAVVVTAELQISAGRAANLVK